MRTSISAEERALKWIKEQNGLIRSKDAISSGIYARTLTQLTKEGKLEQISRGVYRLSSGKTISNPDLVTVAVGVPKAVICLISALSFHKLTTQIPHKVYIALPELTRTPKQDYPPISIHRFRGKAYEEGIENHIIDGVNVRIYNPEKTLADCFKFRNKIGMDVVLEAMKFYRSKKRFDIKAITMYAKICRVENQMKPYLEAMI